MKRLLGLEIQNYEYDYCTRYNLQMYFLCLKFLVFFNIPSLFLAVFETFCSKHVFIVNVRTLSDCHISLSSENSHVRMKGNSFMNNLIRETIMNFLAWLNVFVTIFHHAILNTYYCFVCLREKVVYEATVTAP